MTSCMEQRLQTTQYGFRAQKGCYLALHNIRKLVVIGEGTPCDVYMLLLGWQRALIKSNILEPCIEWGYQDT
eukprot:7592610-Karenia_brevis.AAC.1